MDKYRPRIVALLDAFKAGGKLEPLEIPPPPEIAETEIELDEHLEALKWHLTDLYNGATTMKAFFTGEILDTKRQITTKEVQSHLSKLPDEKLLEALEVVAAWPYRPVDPESNRCYDGAHKLIKRLEGPLEDNIPEIRGFLQSCSGNINAGQLLSVTWN